MAIISYREYARQKGVSLQAIQNRIKRGTISPRAIVKVDGYKWPKIDSDIADADFAVMKNDDCEAAQLLGSEALPQAEPQTPKVVDPIDEMFGPAPVKRQKSILEKKLAPVDKPTTKVVEIDGEQVEVHVEPNAAPESHLYFNQYRKAKAGTEGLKARKLELEVAELEDRLLDKQDVQATLQKLVSLTREKLLNLPSKISSDLIAVTELIEMETKLYKEINLALEDLAKVSGAF